MITAASDKTGGPSRLPAALSPGKACATGTGLPPYRR